MLVVVAAAGEVLALVLLPPAPLPVEESDC